MFHFFRSSVFFVFFHQTKPGFEHEKVQLCATCQKMVRSETGSAGVMSGLPRSITVEIVARGCSYVGIDGLMNS